MAADKKIVDLPALAEALASGDLFEAVDVSDPTDDPTGSSVRVTRDQLLAAAALLDAANTFSSDLTVGGTLAVGGGFSVDQLGNLLAGGSISSPVGAWSIDADGNFSGAEFFGSGGGLTGVARLASANTFTAGPQVFVGGVTVRESGGTPGVQEVQITHDGTRTIVQSLTGPIRFLIPGALTDRHIEIGQVSGVPAIVQQGNICLANIRLNAAGSTQGWDVDTTTVDLVATWFGAGVRFTDARVGRAAAKVVDLSDATGTTGATLRSLPLSPASLSADQDNYSPGVARNYRLTATVAVNITGLSVSQVDGQECRLCNVGANNVTLKNQNAGSSAANRFLFSAAADVVLTPNKTLGLWYDGVTQAWRDS